MAPTSVRIKFHVIPTLWCLLIFSKHISFTFSGDVIMVYEHIAACNEIQQGNAGSLIIIIIRVWNAVTAGERDDIL